MTSKRAAQSPEKSPALAEVIDIETGEIHRIKKSGSPAQSNQGGEWLKTTTGVVKNDHEKRQKSASKKSFMKLNDVGSHALMGMPVCRTSKIIFLMMRESLYGGRCFITPAIVASELGIEVRNACTLLRKVEAEGFAVKVETDTGYFYQINPMYATAGTHTQEEEAKRTWARAMSKKMRTRKKADPK